MHKFSDFILFSLNSFVIGHLGWIRQQNRHMYAKVKYFMCWFLFWKEIKCKKSNERWGCSAPVIFQDNTIVWNSAEEEKH